MLLSKETKLSILASKSCVWAQALLPQMFAAVYLAALMYNPGKQAQIESDDVEAAGRRRVSVEQRLYLNLVLAKSLGRNSSAVSSGSAGCGRPVVSSLGISEKFPTRLEINAAHLLSGGD